MKLIDKAKQHLEVMESIEIDVPEWGCVIFAKPMTLRERQGVVKKTDGDELAILAEIVILKACDDAGNKLFDRNDKMALMREVDGAIVERIASRIYKHDAVEDAEKN